MNKLLIIFHNVFKVSEIVLKSDNFIIKHENSTQTSLNVLLNDSNRLKE